MKNLIDLSPLESAEIMQMQIYTTLGGSAEGGKEEESGVEKEYD